MRSFALVVLGVENEIIDRYKLPLVINPQGLGFALKLSTVETDIEGIITKVQQERGNIKFTVLSTGYQEGYVLAQWIQRYAGIEYEMALEYNDGFRIRYCTGKVVELTKTELAPYGVLPRELTFKPTSSFFSNETGTIKIAISASGKSYPFMYPYAYGKAVLENNAINNEHIASVPLIVKVTGTCGAPVTIQLLDEAGNAYNKVQFTELALGAAEYLVINSARHRIYFFDGSELTDYTAYTDPSYDTFLRADPGRSTIAINLEAGDSGSLTATWRKGGLL